MGIKLMNSAAPAGHEKMVIQTSDPSGGHLRLFPGTNQIVLTSITPDGGDPASYRSTDSGDSYDQLPDSFPRPIITSQQNIAVSFQNRYYHVGDPSTIDGSAWVATSSNGGSSWEYNVYSESDTRRFGDVRSSRDGKYILASNGAYNDNGDAVLSQDFGQTWTRPVGLGYWVRCYVSPDGQNMLIGSFQSNATKYSDDYGDNWSTFSETLSSLGGAGISGDGNYKVVHEQYESSGGAKLYVSTNWVDWTQHNLTVRLIGLSISNDGKYMLVAASDGFNSPEAKVSLSTDYGVSFSEITLSDTTYWSGTAMSSDGKYMIAIPGFNADGYVYKSIDYGSTWAKETSIPQGRFNNVQMSRSGRYVYLAGRNGGGVWHSKDYMATWTQQFDASTSSGMFINF